MHVGAINNLEFTSRQHRPAKKAKRNDVQKGFEIQNNNNIPNHKMTNATKGLVVGLMMLPAAGGVITSLPSCNAKAEAYAYAESDCCCDTCGDPNIVHHKDTIWMHDTIPVVIENHDTIYLKENFESPVIDTLKNILGDLGIDLGDGYVPVTMSYVDELDTKYDRNIFDGKTSSKDLVVYDRKEYPWDDVMGSFVTDDYLADKAKLLLSLTNDGELYISKWVPKQGALNPTSLSDYRPVDLAYKLTRNNAQQVIEKLRENGNSGTFNWAGTIEKGALPKSIQHTNEYGTSWRWTNYDVQSADVPKSRKK